MLKQKISAPIAIGIILILSVALGSFTISQLSEMRKERRAPFSELKFPEKKSSADCKQYAEDNCPSGCIVCPPCEVCSSLGCNSAELCKKMGFDKSWYENIKIQRETAGWQTYKSEELGFEIKYPSSFQEGKGCLYNSSFLPCILSLKGTSLHFDQEGVDIYIGETEEDLEYCLFGLADEQSGIEEININEITFNKVKSELDAAMGGKRTIGYMYKAIHNNQCYFITSEFNYTDVNFAAGAGVYGEPTSIAPQEEIDKQNEEINVALNELEEIIKTFKFID